MRCVGILEPEQASPSPLHAADDTGGGGVGDLVGDHVGVLAVVDDADGDGVLTVAIDVQALVHRAWLIVDVDLGHIGVWPVEERLHAVARQRAHHENPGADANPFQYAGHGWVPAVNPTQTRASLSL